MHKSRLRLVPPISAFGPHGSTTRTSPAHTKCMAVQMQAESLPSDTCKAPAFNSASTSDHDFPKASSRSYDAISGERSCEEFRDSVRHSPGSIFSALSLASSPNLADELAEAFNHDCSEAHDYDIETGEDFTRDSAFAADTYEGNWEHDSSAKESILVVGNLAEGQTGSPYADVSTLNSVYGQNRSNASPQHEARLEAPHEATDNMMHQDTVYSDTTHPHSPTDHANDIIDLDPDIALLRDVMKDDDEMNTQ
jgi:hypothetical protein